MMRRGSGPASIAVMNTSLPAVAAGPAAPGRQALKTRLARERILQAAIAVIRSGGLAAASTASIASQAGLTWGAAQHHFGSKEEILEAVLGASHEQFTCLMADERLRRGPERGRAELLVDLMWEHYRSDLYVAALDILLAKRGKHAQVRRTLATGQVRAHLQTMRAIFPRSRLADRELLRCLELLHCFLTGLVVDEAFEDTTHSQDRFLAQIKSIFCIALRKAP
jgi:AcrR family transcriptional regulator